MNLSGLDVLAIISVCVTAITIALIWRTTKHKYR